MLSLNKGQIYTAASDAILPDCISCSFERGHVVARERYTSLYHISKLPIHFSSGLHNTLSALLFYLVDIIEPIGLIINYRAGEDVNHMGWARRDIQRRIGVQTPEVSLLLHHIVVCHLIAPVVTESVPSYNAGCRNYRRNRTCT